tara:strand:+ start:2774 stop:4144 length:1371 start_codon:yes stop_codon:yes gene_type:complete
MSKIVVLPYKTGSASAKTVSDMLGVKRMLVAGSKLKDSEETTIVNWGNSTTDLSGLPSVKVINKQEGIRKASNKRDFFRAIQDHNEVSDSPISIPDWTEDSAVAKEWYESGHDVVCRHTLQGHSGEGIEVVKFREEEEAEHAVPEAPLYTKYVKKRDEYRVHVVAKEAIFVQRKGRERDDDGSTDINYQIRNHANGFIFLTQDLNPHKTVISESIKAVNALGLDFGAVDVIWNERRKAATVIEVNTACGLQSPSNILRYRHALKALLANEEQLPWDSPCEREGEQERQVPTDTTGDLVVRFEPTDNIGAHVFGIAPTISPSGVHSYRPSGTLTGQLTATEERSDNVESTPSLIRLTEELSTLYGFSITGSTRRMRSGETVWLRPRAHEVLRNYIVNNPGDQLNDSIIDIRSGSMTSSGLQVLQRHLSLIRVLGPAGLSMILPESVLTTSISIQGGL